eukprot:Transcript_6930.p2 GENE.Transcript_6930~~Transcript_6930.p2  ORF type:complete len:543 (-),score=212.14 Transcript_6930:84-1661(-)
MAPRTPTRLLLLFVASAAARAPRSLAPLRPTASPCSEPAGQPRCTFEAAALRLRGGGRSVPASGQLQPQTGLHGDYGALALLLLLYTLQGIPIGLSAVVPMVLAEKQVSSLDQAVFSIVQYPFAMKLLWAPLVDSVYSRWVGRRKSWILPVQPAIGALMLYSSGKVEAILGSAAPNVKVLTGYFLAFYMLAATQDIAVDGLALTALSERNKELGATCNAIGQTLGYALAYVGYLWLSSRGLATIGGFMAFWGWAFIASTLAVLVGGRGKDEHGPPLVGARASRRVLGTYREMVAVLQLPAVRSLALVLLTMKAPLAAFESLVPLELVKLGVAKERLAALNMLLLPVSMATQAAVSRYFVDAKPMKYLLRGYRARLAYGAAVVALVAALGYAMRAAPARLPPIYAAGVLAACGGAAASAVVFVAQMAFFNRVSDPKIGGTYMTMLNTLANLGGQWPGTLVLATKGAVEKLPGQPNGFHAVASCSVLLGLAWLHLMQGRARALAARPKADWLATEEDAEGSGTRRRR